VPPTPQPTINPKSFVALATVGGLLLSAAVLLWVFDVVPFEAFIGAVAVVAVGQALVILVLLRKARERANRAGQVPGGASTLGPDGPAARYGYDPMGDLDGRR